MAEVAKLFEHKRMLEFGLSVSSLAWSLQQQYRGSHSVKEAHSQSFSQGAQSTCEGVTWEHDQTALSGCAAASYVSL